MKILIDENIPLAEAFFGELGELQFAQGRLLQQKDVQDADVLLIRSVTQVNEALLEGSRVGFVGSATIGVDHLDTAYLDQQGITWTTAPGCNARAVVEYVAAALLELEARTGKPLTQQTLGIVGVGMVGSRLRRLAEAWGMQVIACDPPLADQGQPGLVAMDEIMQADIISLHVPLTKNQPHPTWHLFDKSRLEQLKREAVLINSARGAVVDNQALKQVLEARPDLQVVLDVWENEPLIDAELAQWVEIATPHIAGYSYDGKVSGTEMVYQALCQHLQRPATKSLTDLIPAELTPVLDCRGDARVNDCHSLVQKAYRIDEDDLKLRSALQHETEHRAAAFDQLRKHYPLRRGFSQVELRGVEALHERFADVQIQRAQVLGFDIEV